MMEQRLTELARLIAERGSLTTAEIVEQYGISSESARRDLRMLEQRGLCKRTHGGAVIPQQVNILPPADRDYAQMPVFPNYREIARLASQELHENDVVYLTSGSLGYLMLPFIPKEKHFTLVVNSVEVARELRAFPNADVYVMGGKMRRSASIVDSMAQEMVSRFHFDVCLLTGGGLTAAFGLSNGTPETAAFQRTVLANSRRRILLMPSGKIGVDSLIKVCDADAFDTLITDWDCPEEELTALSERSVRVVTAQEPA